jgi:hypothetical protein
VSRDGLILSFFQFVLLNFLDRYFHFGRINLWVAERLQSERFVVWLHGGRLGQAKDLYHTVKSHSVANSGTNSGCSISKDSVACGLYPILEYHFFRNSLLG